MDQQLGSAAINIEQLLRRGLGLAAPSTALRSIKIKALKDSASQPLPQDQWSQALQHFLQHAPDRRALEDKLNRFQARGTPAYRELLVLLHMMSVDPSLAPLLAKGFKLDASDALRPATAASMTQPAPPAAHVIPARPAGTAGLPSPALADPLVARPRSAVPGQLPTARAAATIVPTSSRTGVQAHAQLTPPAALPAPAAFHPPRLSIPETSQELPGSTTPAANPRSATLPATNLGARLNSSMDSQNGDGGIFRGNPVFNQEDGYSPAPRSRAYTPTLAEGMSAARMRGDAPPPRPNIASTGNLFSCSPMHTLTEVLDPVMAEVLKALPAWDSHRPHLAGLDLIQAAQHTTSATSQADETLGTLPLIAQEVAVMNDLLYTFLGLQGSHVAAILAPSSGGEGPALAYMVRASLQPCTRELVERVLPLCEYVAVLKRFVETRSAYGCGLVSHAVCAAMRRLLSDWALVVAQLEHQLRLGKLTLQALVFYCQGPLASLGLVARLAAEAASQQLTSAGLLNLLHAKVTALAGDQSGRTLMHRLLTAAAVPYFKQLERWVHEGVLDDPYGEFMVQEDKAVTKDALTQDQQLAYWSQRYRLRVGRSTGSPGEGPELDVPFFLAGMADTILTTGKYLNAIRECGQPVTRPLGTHSSGPASLAYDAQGTYLPAVHSAHASASQALLRLLHDQGLTGWLRSLKHFFLLDQGDLVVYLAEAAAEELAKPASQLSTPRLQSLLELSVRTSSLGQDPHADAMQLELDPRGVMDLARAAGVLGPNTASASAAAGATPARSPPKSRRAGDSLRGWQVVLLRARLAWPLSLVVPPAAMARYQLVFRHLFSLKHAERQLASTWHRMQPARGASKEGRDGLRSACSLVHKYLFLIQEVLRYSSMDVLEPAWRSLEEGIRTAQDVDQIIACHTSFLARAIDGLLLSRRPLLRPLEGLVEGAVELAENVASAWDALDAQQQAHKQQQQQQQQQQRPLPGGARQPAGGTGSAGSRTSSSGSRGAPLAPAESKNICARREAFAAPTVLATKLAMSNAALGAVQLSPVELHMGGVAQEFTNRVNELQAGLRELYDEAMRREGRGGVQASGQPLETREQVEALLGLMGRLQLQGAGTASGISTVTGYSSDPPRGVAGTGRAGPGAGGGGGGAPRSTAAAYSALAAAAAQLG